MINITNNTQRKWQHFLENNDNNGHANRVLLGHSVDEHIHTCYATATQMVTRLRNELGEDFKPGTILEIGSSSGLNCLALQAAFPKAQVIGVEPEKKAVEAAVSLSAPKLPQFIECFAENLPLTSGSVNLIVCHTVIEHVKNVSDVISEMARVLNEDGVAHIEAPNYIYPYEPHLKIYTIPLLGKRFVKLTAILQGKMAQVKFLDHLQFVTPTYLTSLFSQNNLDYENRALKKLQDASAGNAQIKKYKLAAFLLAIFRRLNMHNFVIDVIDKVGLYPSVMYTVRKRK